MRKISSNRISQLTRWGLLAATAFSLAAVSQATAAGIPVVVTKDKVNGIVGELRGIAKFTEDALGHSGKAGDTAMDFGSTGAGQSVYLSDAKFLNIAGTNDSFTIVGWQKLYNVVSSALFWGVSPSSSGSTRGIGTHAPWGDGTLYFDTAGCCAAGTQRLNANINTLPDYWGDATWWTNWHHIVFLKNKGTKEIWIDGVMFVQSDGTANPLPTDFTVAYLGYDAPDNASMHGLLDDFAIFATPLDEANIQKLFTGTAPTALPSSTQLLAFWEFNDFPAEGAFTGIIPTPDTTTAAPNLVQIGHTDGSAVWDASKVSLKIDGAEVAVTFVKNGKNATVSYVPSAFFDIQSKHTATFTYPTATGTASFDWTFTVGAYTKDSVANIIGSISAGSKFTPPGGGASGKPGDYAMDFGTSGGPVVVDSVAFLNAATAKDELTFSFWLKKYGVNSGSAFWGLSPSSNESERGWQAHVPWGDGTIYFDTAGCCDAATQRINANINTFADYTGDAGWWTNWHYFVFSKKADIKQIWIDGKIFMEGSSTGVLPTDFRQLLIGSSGSYGGVTYGVMDDFAVWSKQLQEADIVKLATGTLPPAIASASGLSAYWGFNDIPVDGVFMSFTPADGSTNNAPSLVQVQHSDGSTPWDLTKVSLSIDGQVASTATVVRDVNVVTVKYVPSPIFAQMSTHTASLTYPVAAGGTKTTTWSFTVGKYTKDVTKGYVGAIRGSANFTADGGGHSAKAGDYAIDLSKSGGPVQITEAAFMTAVNAATASDELSVAAWIKKYDIADSSAFWFSSPTQGRVYQAHVPWSNNNIYFDTAGCCGGDTRINAGIDTFADYTGDVGWWTNWHHFVFTKKADVKQVWINGKLFLEGSNTGTLSVDINQLMIGSDNASGGLMHGIVDDFAVFAKALAEADIVSLAGQTLPSALPTATGLLAYWNFNDAYKPVTAVTLSYAKAGNTLTITYTGKLQASDSVTGGWTDVSGATSPFAVTIPATGNKFYRAASQ